MKDYPGVYARIADQVSSNLGMTSLAYTVVKYARCFPFSHNTHLGYCIACSSCTSTCDVAKQWEEWIKPTICQNHSDPKPSFCPSSPEPPTPTPPSPTPPTGCESDEDLFTFSMTTDNYGEDITWRLRQRNSKGKFRQIYPEFDKEYGDNQEFVEEYCIPKNEW